MSKEVSCKMLDVFFRKLTDKGLSPALLAEGTGVGIKLLRDKHERIDWKQFVKFMANAGRVWSDDQLVEIGNSFFDAPYIRPFSIIARFLFSAPQFYKWIFSRTGGVGAEGFNCVESTFSAVSDLQLRLGMNLPAGYEPCPEFFFVSKGNFEGMPRVLGLRRARVEMELTPAGASYLVTVPAGGGLLRKVWRFLAWPFTMRAAAEELREAHTALQSRYKEIEEAKGVVLIQAEQLQTVNLLGRELTTYTELKALSDSVSKLLIERFHCAGLRFWMAKRPGEAFEIVREVGQLSTGELRSFSLTTGGEALGRIETRGQRGPIELLDALLPWISIALENVRNFALLREHQEQLEQKVEQRTADLQRTKEQLEQSLQRLTELDRQKTEFFGNASHELRTPLTLLLAPLEVLSASPGLSLEARQDIRASLHSAYRLLKLINDLLDLSKIEVGKMELRLGAMDLARILEEVVRPWRPALEKRKVRLELRFPPALPFVGDGERIEQVALNLVSNAVKYVPDGGWLRVEAGAKNDGVEFVIQNSGPGIDPEDVPRLFERFGQSLRSKSRRFGSTGLGLPVVRELVRLHGGRVDVENIPGEGVGFRVQLPGGLLDAAGAPAEVPLPGAIEIQQYQSVSMVPEEEQPEPIRRQDGRPLLLIAEDNADVRRVLVRNLREEFEILEAANGMEALRLAKEQLPRIVLSDLMMPELDGIELCKALKKAPETMGIPFILLTARTDMEVKLSGLAAGADDYVIKPFHLEEVRARLRAQLRLASLAETVSQRERLASLGVLVAGVAHEIRNPLNGIINSLLPLKALVSGSSATAGDLIDLALASAHRVDEISLQLLQQARPVDGHKSEVDLALNVSLAVRLLSHKTEAGPRLIAEIPTRTHIGVMGEPGALNQVWVNLIDNAIHAAGPTGEVTVRVGIEGHSAQVEVLDTGPGIAPQNMKKIFDPFFTTKPVGLGLGLGLSLVRDTIQKHGGEITVHSSPGEGSRFKITLPMVAAVGGEAHASG